LLGINNTAAPVDSGVQNKQLKISIEKRLRNLTVQNRLEQQTIISISSWLTAILIHFSNKPLAKYLMEQ
jgi:hypothetical protein